MDEQLIYFGGAVKALGNGKVGGHLVRFTDENELDLEREFFDATTDYGKAATSAVYYNHGLLENAIAEMKEAMAEGGETMEMHSILARLYVEAGQTERAMAEYDCIFDK